MSFKKRALFFLLLGLLSYSHSALKLQTFATGLSLPVAMVDDPTNPDVKFVVQQRGRIKVLVNGVLQTTDFLNLVGTVNSTGSERGLLGIALHPNYAINGYFYVNYTAASPSGTTKIVRYQRSANPLIANSASAYQILSITQPYQNHNGGSLRFGPDGYLYIGMGDGGDANDPGNRAQTITNMLLGKFLRIDVNSDGFPADATKNYAIPLTNPFVNVTGDDEIWSFGIRNPWKFSFDMPSQLGSGGMIIGDVGQDAYEELNYEPPLAGGRNYGWRQYEGFHSTGLSGASGVPRTDPFWEYTHYAVQNSITGGPIYRGTQLTGLFGNAFCGDYVTGKMWTMPMSYQPNGEANITTATEITTDLAIPSGTAISSIDTDSNGEMYIVSYGGTIYRILPENLVWITDLAPLIYSTYEGTIRHLMATDSQYLIMLPQNVYDYFEENQSQMKFGFMTDNLASSTIRYSVRAMSNALSNGKLVVYLKNWSTGRYDLQATYTTNMSAQTYAKTGIAATSYRRGDGRIEVMIQTYYQGIPPSDPYQTFIDQIRLDPF